MTWALLKWLTAFSMAVVCVRGFDLFKRHDEICSKSKLDPLLFGSKTSYRYSYKYLQTHHKIPRDFSRKTLHKYHRLLAHGSCLPVQFYFLGRHGARYPLAKQIKEFEQTVSTLIEKMKNEAHIEACPKKFEAFFNYKLRILPEYDTLITKLGAEDQRKITLRYKHLFPQFFDSSRSEINFNCTKELRTAQTSIELLKEITGFRPDGCENLGSIPTIDTLDPSLSVKRIREDKCLNSITSKYDALFLYYNMKTRSSKAEKRDKKKFLAMISESRAMGEVRRRVSRRLGLKEGNEINVDQVKIILQLCAFEIAIWDSSIWCSLLGNEDANVINFIDDYRNYLTVGETERNDLSGSCPLLLNIIESIEAARVKYLDGISSEKLTSHFYFSHSTELEKLMAAFGLFVDKETFNEDNLMRLVDKANINQKRNFNLSLSGPFSSNFAFILYRCQKPQEAQAKFKLLTALNEKPIKFPGCKDVVCELDEFYSSYEMASQTCASKLSEAPLDEAGGLTNFEE